MKLKLTIALVILALVLGFVLTACDDGEVITITEKTKNISGTDVETEQIFDRFYVPYFNGNEKPESGIIRGVTGDTTGLEAPELEDLFADPSTWY